MNAPIIKLCSGIYNPSCAGLPPVHVICQIMIIGGLACAWVDGISMTKPLLLPIDALQDFKHRGTLADYLRDEKHAELDADEFMAVQDECLARNASATIMIRAYEMMHSEGLTASEAITCATEWGVLLNQINEAECAAYGLL